MRSLLPILLLVSSAVVAAEQDIYKWTDARGITHYSDERPADQQVKQLQLEPEDLFSTQRISSLNTNRQRLEHSPGEPSSGTDFAAMEYQEKLPIPKITLYTWVDNQGIKHYTNTPPNDKQLKPVELKGAPANEIIWSKQPSPTE